MRAQAKQLSTTSATLAPLLAIARGRQVTSLAAYWLLRCRIDDPVQYKRYTDFVPAIIKTHGVRVLARGGRYQIMEGP